MDIANSEKGRATASKIARQKMDLARLVREHLAAHYRLGSFEYYGALRFVHNQDVKISSGNFQKIWTDLKRLRVLTEKDCQPGHWRFDPKVYYDRYRQVLDPPAVPTSESVVHPPLPPRRTEAFQELRKHLPGLLSRLPKELVVKALRQVHRGLNPVETGQLERLRRLLEVRMSGLSDSEQDELRTELLVKIHETTPPHLAD